MARGQAARLDSLLYYIELLFTTSQPEDPIRNPSIARYVCANAVLSICDCTVFIYIHYIYGTYEWQTYRLFVWPKSILRNAPAIFVCPYGVSVRPLSLAIQWRIMK